MLSKLRARLSYANVIATIALFVALGGGAYAATQLPKNSVGAKQLKKGSVNSAKVKDASLMRRDFKPGQLPAGPAGARGPEGPRGAEGARGEAGPTGARGPSNAYNDRDETQIAISSTGTAAATVQVPAGSWVLTGKVQVFNNGIDTSGNCSLFAASTRIDRAFFELESIGANEINEVPLAVSTARTVAVPTTFQLVCEELSTAGVDVRISERQLTAIQVETLTQQ